MIKQILGEQHGLVLQTQKKHVYISPVKKNKIILTAKNQTEYDMHLYVSVNFDTSIGCNKKEFDFFVPAEGDSRTEICIELSQSNKLYFGHTILEVCVHDRVLEWQNTYEIPIFCENVFKCAASCNFSACDGMLASSESVIYLNKGEYAMLMAASDKEMPINVKAQRGDISLITENSEKCADTSFILKKGLNRLCINAVSDTAFFFEDDQTGNKICLNTVNPKYFM